jgi:hypothetical protein
MTVECAFLGKRTSIEGHMNKEIQDRGQHDENIVKARLAYDS